MHLWSPLYPLSSFVGFFGRLARLAAKACYLWLMSLKISGGWKLGSMAWTARRLQLSQGTVPCNFFKFLDGAHRCAQYKNPKQCKYLIPSLQPPQKFQQYRGENRKLSIQFAHECPWVPWSQPLSDQVPALGTGTVVQCPLPQGGDCNVARWATLIWQEPQLFSQQTIAAVDGNYWPRFRIRKFMEIWKPLHAISTHFWDLLGSGHRFQICLDTERSLHSHAQPKVFGNVSTTAQKQMNREKGNTEARPETPKLPTPLAIIGYSIYLDLCSSIDPIPWNSRTLCDSM